MRLKCGQGHTWDSEQAGAAPLVCPTCGSTAVDMNAAASQADALEDMEQTLDLPPSTGRGAMTESDSEVTQTFTPAPTPTTPPPGKTPAPSRQPASSKPSAAQITSTAMPFSIIRQHARGGLGVVNLARDVNIKREVALKQILAQHAGNGVLKRRFLYEAQITGQLEHPSIVPVYCLGADDSGNPYYVMRFVKGRTLDEIIKEHHQATNLIVFREVLRRFIAVCQAVAYAHSRGVIHRDLKPANVMLGDYGETLVLDWGLAKDIRQGGADPAMWHESSQASRASANASTAGVSPPAGSPAAQQSRVISPSMAGTADDSELTSHGQIIGTPAYMAPEQAEGRTELHGPVTDIYALGGILYKILTGQSPTAPAASTAGSAGQRKFTFVASPPPSKVIADVPPELERICLRAMATEPAARYQRALEMAQDIQRWLDENPLTSKPHTAAGKFKGVLQRHAMLIITLLLFAILVLTVLLAMKGQSPTTGSPTP